MLNDIKWVPVYGYEDLYEISNEGQIRTKPRNVIDNEGNVVYSVGNQLITIHINSDLKEKYAILWVNNTYNKEYINDLLAKSF